MDEWLVIGALGILFLIVIQLGQQQSLDLSSGSDGRTIVSSYSLRN